MRQCGIIAAAGITALEEMVDRLKDDHANAQRLAQGIASIAGLSIDLERVQTNIVYFDLISQQIKAEKLTSQLDEKGIKILQLGPSRFRAVTHYGISAEDIEIALNALGEIMDKS
jgi:threonine aldolase